MLNTQAMFLQKAREPVCKQFDDEEWLAVVSGDSDAHGDDVHMDADVLEAAVADEAPSNLQVESNKVRPIQMGEFMRKYVSRRLRSVNHQDEKKIMQAMRQIGVGTSGGAEALAIFHQVLYEVWQAGGLAKPLARVKIDEKNCFGSFEWDSVRKAAAEFHPKHMAAAAWKHAAASVVEQEGVRPMVKDRGAEQGDVDGPLECALTLGLVIRDARSDIHQQQRSGSRPWSAVAQEEGDRARVDYDERQHCTRTFPEQRSSTPEAVDPRHQVQVAEGLADFWYLDDGDVLCCPTLVKPFLAAFDK